MEDRILAAFHEWVWNTHPHLRRLCFHPLNEQIGGAFMGAVNKAKGVVSGVADYVCLVRGSRGEPFLCIEFKTEKGGQTERQKEFQQRVLEQGGVYQVARSVEQAKEIWKEYLG
jgi:hypothetical protein